jgi:hypothetical protein
LNDAPQTGVAWRAGSRLLASSTSGLAVSRERAGSITRVVTTTQVNGRRPGVRRQPGTANLATASGCG